jgi:hypothetical protein
VYLLPPRRSASRRLVWLRPTILPVSARRSICSRRTTRLCRRLRRSQGAGRHLLHLAGPQRRMRPAAWSQRGSFQPLRCLPQNRTDHNRHLGAAREGGGLQREDQHFLQEDTHLPNPRCEAEYPRLSRGEPRRSSRARQRTRSARCRSCRGRNSVSLVSLRPAPASQRTGATRPWRPRRPAADPAGSPTAPCTGASPCSLG